MSDGLRSPEALRAALLEAQDLTIEPVATPEWPAVDGELYIRSLTARGRERFFAAVRDNGVSSEWKLVVATLCNAAGAAILTPADLEALAEKHGAPVQRLFDVAQRLNAFGAEAAETAKNASARPPIAAASIG